jgi:hypothetical protein
VPASAELTAELAAAAAEDATAAAEDATPAAEDAAEDAAALAELEALEPQAARTAQHPPATITVSARREAVARDIAAAEGLVTLSNSISFWRTTLGTR